MSALQWVHDNIESFGGDPGNDDLRAVRRGGSRPLLHTPAAGACAKVAAQSGGKCPTATYPAHQGAADDRGPRSEPEPHGHQIDKLKTVPYTALITAGVAALRSAAQELGRPASTGTSSPTTIT